MKQEKTCGNCEDFKEFSSWNIWNKFLFLQWGRCLFFKKHGGQGKTKKTWIDCAFWKERKEK